MCKFIGKKIIYHQYQSNYRKHHSTFRILIKLRNDIGNIMESGEVSFVIFANYSRTFSTIYFDILLRKMHKLNFSTGFLN